MASAENGSTHDVFNQSTPFVDINLFTSRYDFAVSLCQGGRRAGGQSSERAWGGCRERLTALELARQANENLAEG